MEIDDAITFIYDCIQSPCETYSSYGYDLHMPNVILAYLKTIEHNTEHISRVDDSPRAKELSPVFYEAAWHLCRRGVLRPSVRKLGEQGAATGDGYCVTSIGQQWLERGAPSFIFEPGRLGALFGKLSERLGTGFLQRASEAAEGYRFGIYLGCCAMCGAAAESILLAVAVAKSRDERTTLKDYRAAKGRQKVIDRITAGLNQGLAEPFRNATGLLSYWRDDAAHGQASTISEIEAHEAHGLVVPALENPSRRW